MPYKRRRTWRARHRIERKAAGFLKNFRIFLAKQFAERIKGVKEKVSGKICKQVQTTF
jgi:hypothetical protein